MNVHVLPEKHQPTVLYPGPAPGSSGFAGHGGRPRHSLLLPSKFWLISQPPFFSNQWLSCSGADALLLMVFLWFRLCSLWSVRTGKTIPDFSVFVCWFLLSSSVKKRILLHCTDLSSNTYISLSCRFRLCKILKLCVSTLHKWFAYSFTTMSYLEKRTLKMKNHRLKHPRPRILEKGDISQRVTVLYKYQSKTSTELWGNSKQHAAIGWDCWWKTQGRDKLIY